jgi:hypothetical protein
VLDLLEHDPGVRKACLLFRYEDLCTQPASLIDAILAHCQLPHTGFESIRTDYIKRLAPPDYYAVDFAGEELHQIGLHCTAVNENLSKFCQNP